MGASEPKKLALLRIKDILEEHSDYDHPITQEEIVTKLKTQYGIDVDRKTVGRNLSLLKEAGVEIESKRGGSYIAERRFDDSELRLLIDGVLSSKHVTAKQSQDLIERICELSNKYFKASVRHVRSVNEWSKTENQAVFYNIELVHTAIEEARKITFSYNKYGTDKKLHRSSNQTVSPYLMLLHNQRYYLRGYNDRYQTIQNYRLDRITNMEILDEKAFPLKKVPGNERGIDYKLLGSAYPYMFSDEPERIDFTADKIIVDQVIDWFGKDITISETADESKVSISLTASPMAMKYWALQYINGVEIIRPEKLRSEIIADLEKGLGKYKGQ
jgi:predicted DNA-binding transcriptional regulator YafY